jgi:twitching motility protein PilT
MDLDALLRRAVELGATDVHLKEGKPPILRRDGALGPMEGAAALTIGDLEAILELVGASVPARLQLFHNTGDLDVAYQSLDLPRFRVNAFRQRGSISSSSASGLTGFVPGQKTCMGISLGSASRA